MKRTMTFGLALALGLGAVTSAEAKVEDSSARRLLFHEQLRLADNVVVTPGAPTTSVPAAPAPAAPQAAVVATPSETRVVHANVESSHNYMSTLAVSALMGGVVGVLVGGSIYYLGDRGTPRDIALWGAGGVLLGTGVGVLQLVVQENRVSSATALDRLPSDPAPTFRVALMRTKF